LFAASQEKRKLTAAYEKKSAWRTCFFLEKYASGLLIFRQINLWRSLMGRECQVTGKKTRTGNHYSIRGIAKKKKGIGLKTTGIKRRRFLPNLMKKRFWFAEENRFITLKVTPNGMRTIDKVGLASVVRKIRASGKSL